ncbi:hypothetical protein IRZ71_18415 [Flavobacterium sp. ANB]|jgi:hypothetical protein|uniref:DUF6624 domain-containing protein n=1 Tax=unclassified Flavobacterium TaxID=196869 RepID=UPI0012B8EBD4|nr:MULTISPECIES: DUF6624 domain-containing protein [unclassified Flavobacterium]MBF4518334.1 hypothetical protein [Flavobacterium sp. ANB]MTD70969.1 hypothetical protein [Flavobacterium sp. LC2016-13]
MKMKLQLLTIFSMFCLVVSGQDYNLAFRDVTQQLLTIDELDQRYRIQIDETISRFGNNSKESKALFKNMKTADSLNLIQVETIIDRYGWIGADKIGSQANTTLFMVIQHAELPTQIKYLPIMRAAVKEGNAKAGSLALLEDRVALKQGKKQIYGSQVSWNMQTNEKFVAPLEDPDNVDKRRAEAGLPSLQDYLTELDMKWDVEKYKKEMPAIEEAFFKKKNKIN